MTKTLLLAAFVSRRHANVIVEKIYFDSVDAAKIAAFELQKSHSGKDVDVIVSIIEKADVETHTNTVHINNGN